MSSKQYAHEFSIAFLQHIIYIENVDLTVFYVCFSAFSRVVQVIAYCLHIEWRVCSTCTYLSDYYTATTCRMFLSESPVLSTHH